MSSFLTGIIELNEDRIYRDGKYSKEFDKGLYSIQKAGFDQNLTILMGGNVPSYVFNDIKEFIPSSLRTNQNTTNFMITKSPEDNTSDELFIDWEYEASQIGYIPGKAIIFKEVENFFKKVFFLKAVKSIWLRYRSMFRCDVNKLNSLSDLESQIYQQCSTSQTFSVGDFEIYKEKHDYLQNATGGTMKRGPGQPLE